MRLACVRKCDQSIRFRRQHGLATAALLYPNIAQLPAHPRHAIPDKVVLPIAGQGTRKRAWRCAGKKSRRAEAHHIRLLIDLRQTVATTEGGDRRILAGELAQQTIDLAVTGKVQLR